MTCHNLFRNIPIVAPVEKIWAPGEMGEGASNTDYFTER